VRELGKGFDEGLMVCLLHSGKKGGAETRDCG